MKQLLVKWLMVSGIGLLSACATNLPLLEGGQSPIPSHFRFLAAPESALRAHSLGG